MRRLLLILLFVPSLLTAQYSSESGHIVLNPLTGNLEFVSNPYIIGDSLINLGYDNSISQTTLSTLVGYGNFLSQPDCIVFGWSNTVNCSQNFALGKYIKCNSDKVLMLGMSDKSVEAKMPGSIAFCPMADWAVMHIHSGYGMPNDGWEGNKGGVRIGYGKSYADGDVALEVIAHKDTATSSQFGPPTGDRIIATENDEWVVEPDEVTFAGSVEVANVDSPYTPRVYSGAADTSLLPTPFKVGDYYIDTDARDVYISTGTARGDWKKVN